MFAKAFTQDFAKKSATKKHFNIVVAGEFNSGKSSVINLLLRKEVVPASLTVSDFPPAKITPSHREEYNIHAARTGQKIGKTQFLDGMTVDELGKIEIETPLQGFDGAAILEVSVGQDGTLSRESEAVLASADLLVWCTMGQRAWCLSEISIVEQLPGKLLETAVLAVSRSDYLRNTTDLSKVERRLTREAAPFFNNILMLDSSRKSLSAMHEADSWAQSGGSQLFDLVSTELEKSEFAGQIRLAPTETEETTPVVSEPKREGGAISHVEIFSAWGAELDAIAEWVSDREILDDRQFARHVRQRTADFSEAILPLLKPDDNALAGVKLFALATDHLDRVLAGANINEIGALAAELALQLQRELQPNTFETRVSAM